MLRSTTAPNAVRAAENKAYAQRHLICATLPRRVAPETLRSLPRPKNSKVEQGLRLFKV
jgi:hypothetical protein